MKKQGRFVLIFTNKKWEHLSIMDKDYPLIKGYLQEGK